MFTQNLDTCLPVAHLFKTVLQSYKAEKAMKADLFLIISLLLAFKCSTKASKTSSKLKAQLRNSAYSNIKGK